MTAERGTLTIVVGGDTKVFKKHHHETFEKCPLLPDLYVRLKF